MISPDRIDSANTALVEEFGPHAANTFSIDNTVEKGGQEYCVACWNLNSVNFNRLKAKMYRRVAIDSYNGKANVMRRLDFKRKSTDIKPSQDIISGKIGKQL